MEQYEGHEKSQQNVDDDNTDAVGNSVANAFPLVVSTLQEETYRHRNDGPYARSEQSDESSKHSQQEDAPKTPVLCLRSSLESLEFIHNRTCRPNCGRKTSV